MTHFVLHPLNHHGTLTVLRFAAGLNAATLSWHILIRHLKKRGGKCLYTSALTSLAGKTMMPTLISQSDSAERTPSRTRRAVLREADMNVALT